MTELHRSSDTTSEEPQRLTADILSNDQLLILKQLWEEVRASGSSTPMADLRGRMTESGQFHFMDKYNTDNLQLRALATMSEQADAVVRERRRSELDAILRAVQGKNTPTSRLRALQEAGILGENSGVRMSNSDIDTFVREAEEEAARLSESQSTEDDQPESQPSEEAMPQPVNRTSSEESAPTGAQTAEAAEPGATEPEEPDATVPETEEEALKVIALNASVDLRQAAIDFANKRLTNELTSKGNIFKKLARNIWKGNIAKDYYRAKYAREAEVELATEGNFLGKGATREQLVEARRALFERFGLEYEEALHADAGESREVQSEDSAFVQRSKELIRQYVQADSGEFNKESLDQELNRLIREMAQGDSPVLPGGELISVSNLAEIAETVKGRVAHGQAIENVLENMQFITGESRSGVRTDLHQTSVDKLFDKLRTSKNSTLRAISPDALLVASGLAASLAGIGGTRLTATMLSLVPGAAGAVIAVRREQKRTNEDRLQHAREMAQGGSIEAESRRRQEMEGSRYETKRAAELAEALRGLGVDLSSDDTDRQEAIQAALQGLANVNTRIAISDARGIDLVSYSDMTRIGEERLGLDIARAELRVQLDAILDSLTPDERASYGLVNEGDARELARGRGAEADITGDITTKDNAFRKLKAKRVAKAAATGFATGMVFGLAGQEVIAGFSGARQGLAEELWNGRSQQTGSDGAIHQTLLASWVRGEGAIVIPSAYSGTMTMDQFIGGEGTIAAPEGISFRDDGNGLFSILDKDNNEVLTGLEVGSNGQISPESMQLINDRGFGLSEETRTTIVAGQPIEKEVVYDNPGEYVKENGGTEISRRSWADNNTPAPVFDKNELRLWTDGTGADGTVNATIHTMTEDGSYGQGPPVNWKEAQADGELVALVTGSRGTQNWAFELPIDENGAFSIPPDHPAHQFFDVQPNEDWSTQDNFNGAFIEIAQKTVNPDGTIRAHMLATAVGGNEVGQVTETVTTPGEDVAKTTYDYELTPPADTEIAVHTEVAPAIPVVGRRSLEQLKNRNRTPDQMYYYSEAGENPVRGQERSPRLTNDPQVRLNPSEELTWWRNQVEQVDPRRTSRINQSIDNDSYLSDLPRGLKGMVAIPVQATQEARNIYRTLEKYATADIENMDETVILINLNWTRGSRDDPEKEREIRKTQSEIERVRRTYPNLKISVVEHEYNPEQFKETNGAIGYVVKDLYDTALMSIERAVANGTLSNPDDVVIVRNDADTLKMSKGYLDKIYSDVGNHSETDIFQGATRHGLEVSGKLPGLSILTNFDAAVNAAAARRGGAYMGNHNYAIRASTLAAVGGIGIDTPQYTGAGSDDLEIGARIREARGIEGAGSTQGSYGSVPTNTTQGTNAVSRHTYGAQIESDPSRILTAYLGNEGDFLSAWDGFSESPEYYMERGKYRGITETLNSSIRRVENGITALIRTRGVDDPDVRRTLTLFFDVGLGERGYRLTQENDNIRFEFNNEGRKAIGKLIRRQQWTGGGSKYSRRAGIIASRMA